MPLILYWFAILIFFTSHLQPANAYINGRFPGPQFPASLEISGGENCSGAKVSSRLIILAAHCVWPFSVPDPPDTKDGQYVTITDYAGVTTEQYYVKHFWIHPTWRPDLFQIADSASPRKGLLGMDAAIDLAFVETTSDILGIPNAIISTRPVEPGELVTVGGFGLGSPKTGRSFRMRAITRLSTAQKSVLDIKRNSFVLHDQDANQQTRSMAYYGDSGSPVYRWNAQFRRYEIVGVVTQIKDPSNIVLNALTNAYEIAAGKNMTIHVMKLSNPKDSTAMVSDWLRSIISPEVFSN